MADGSPLKHNCYPIAIISITTIPQLQEGKSGTHRENQFKIFFEKEIMKWLLKQPIYIYKRKKKKKPPRRMHKKDTTKSKFNNKKISKVTRDGFLSRKNSLS